MATDSGTWTSSTLPTQYQDPKLSMTATATNAGSGTSITYTTASNHNLVVGQAVITYGYANAWLNYAPNSTVNGVATKLGAGVPAVVASVTSPTVFTVNTGVLTTASSAVAGYIQNDSLVTNQPLDGPVTWLNPTSDKNQAVGLEWGDSFAIQPNTDRKIAAGSSITAAPSATANGTTAVTVATAGVSVGAYVSGTGVAAGTYIVAVGSGAVTLSKNTTADVNGVSLTFTGVSISATAASDVVADGNKITYKTMNAHGLVAGSRINIEGLAPAQFNFNDVLVSSAPSTTTFVIATTVTGVYDYANSFGLIAPINSTGGTVQAVATSAVGPVQVANVTATATAYVSGVTTYTVPSGHGLIAGQSVTISGMVPVAYNITGVIGTSNATTILISNTLASNPGVSTKSGFLSVQSNSYTTLQAHNLIAGQDIAVTGASLAEYNVQSRVVATASANIVNVNAVKYPAAVATNAPVVISGTAVTYLLGAGHNVTTSDSAAVYGYVGGSNLNTVGDVAVSAVATNSVTINTPVAVAAAGITAISAGGGTTITYTATNTFKPGQVVTIAGLSAGSATSFNVNSVIMTSSASAFTVSNGNLTATTSLVLTSGTATVAATTAATALSGVTSVAYDSASITLTVPNRFVVGQSVTVAGLTGGTSYNTTGTVLSADPSQVKIGYAPNVTLSGIPAMTATANAVTVATFALPVTGSAGADASKLGFVVKKGGTFVSPAYVGYADASWGYTDTVSSVQLIPTTDNAEIVRTARLGYPDYYPIYVVPNVVGKTYTNAIQTLQSAGLTGIVASTAASALTVSAATVNGSVVTYTVNSVATLTVGDVVTITGVTDSINSGGTTNTQFNRNLVQVGTIDTVNNKFTVNMTGVTGTYSANGSVQPFNTVVTAQSVAAGTSLTAGTDALSVTLTRFPGLGGTAIGYN